MLAHVSPANAPSEIFWGKGKSEAFSLSFSEILPWASETLARRVSLCRTVKAVGPLVRRRVG